MNLSAEPRCPAAEQRSSSERRQSLDAKLVFSLSIALAALSFLRPDHAGYFEIALGMSAATFYGYWSNACLRREFEKRTAQRAADLTAELSRSNEALEGRVKERTKQLEGVIRNLLEEAQLRECTARELRMFVRKLELVQEEERTRLSREVHDELGQGLTALKLDLAWMVKHSRDETLVERAKQSSLFVDELIQTVRAIASALRPAVLDTLGLGPALEWQTREIEKRSEIRIALSIHMTGDGRRDEAETVLFRAYQEILTNIIRHADATTVEAVLVVEPGSARLMVSDNGCGFQARRTDRGLGLVGMRERVRALNGELKVESSIGCGTIVSITIPLFEQTRQEALFS